MVETQKTGAQQREKLVRRLEKEGEPKLAAKLLKCGLPLSMTCTCCGNNRIVETRCKQRWCPVCCVALSVKRVMRFEDAANKMRWPLAVTLTCQNTLDAQNAVDHIVKAFTKFRRTKFWAERVKGGVASFECTNRGNGWHPHLHVLCDCRWLADRTREPTNRDSKDETTRKLRSAQRELSQHWALALGQTTAIVHARRAFGKSLKETLKYNLKPSELVKCRNRIGAMLWALKGKRLVIPFGDCYDLADEWKKADNAKRKTSPCGTCGQQGYLVPTEIAFARIAKGRRV